MYILRYVYIIPIYPFSIAGGLAQKSYTHTRIIRRYQYTYVYYIVYACTTGLSGQLLIIIVFPDVK